MSSEYSYYGYVISDAVDELPIEELILQHPPDLVLYNRMPKCGSTTTKRMFDKLARRENNFVHFTSQLYHNEDLNHIEQVLYITYLYL